MPEGKIKKLEFPLLVKPTIDQVTPPKANCNLSLKWNKFLSHEKNPSEVEVSLR